MVTVSAVYTAGGLDSAFRVAPDVQGLISLSVLAALPGRTDPVGDVHPVGG